MPRVNHNVPADLYFIRRKLDFFVRHLLGQEPPEYKFKAEFKAVEPEKPGSEAEINAFTEEEHERTI